MAALCGAWALIRLVPFKRWRSSLGMDANACRRSASSWLTDARKHAAHVERAAALLPFRTQCLPRAMALSWILRRSEIGHTLVFAVRPAAFRNSGDDLHAWVEVQGSKVIGDLPGHWLETLRVGSSGAMTDSGDHSPD